MKRAISSKRILLTSGLFLAAIFTLGARQAVFAGDPMPLSLMSQSTPQLNPEPISRSAYCVSCDESVMKMMADAGVSAYVGNAINDAGVASGQADPAITKYLMALSTTRHLDAPASETSMLQK